MLSLAEAQVELVQHMITLKFGKEQIYLKSTIDPRHSPWGGRGEGREAKRLSMLSKSIEYTNIIHAYFNIKVI